MHRTYATAAVDVHSTLSQRRHELLDQRVDLVWNLRRRKMPGIGELYILRSGNGIVDFFFILRRIAMIQQATQEEELWFEPRYTIAHVERVDRDQVVILGDRPHLAVPLHQALAQS